MFSSVKQKALQIPLGVTGTSRVGEVSSHEGATRAGTDAPGARPSVASPVPSARRRETGGARDLLETQFSSPKVGNGIQVGKYQEFVRTEKV